jgi:hypothetical protein
MRSSARAYALRAMVNVAPCPSPRLFARTVAAVHFDQILYNRQPEPQPAMLPLCRTIGLAESLEKMGQKIAAYPLTVVRDTNFHMRLHNLGKHANLPAFGRELDGVSEKIPKRLLEPAWVTADGATSRSITFSSLTPFCFRAKI